VSLFDVEAKVEEASEIEQLTGKLASQTEEQKLMHLVMDNDKEIVQEGRLLKEALNQGLSSFTAELMFEQLVKNYSLAKQLFGESLIRELTGYEPAYVKKNIHIPEFQKELRTSMAAHFQKLKDAHFVDNEGSITDKGVQLASLILYTEELDHLLPKGAFGEKATKRQFLYGDKNDVKEYRKGDRYRDIALRSSLKTAVRRGHEELRKTDLKTFEKESKGNVNLIYALDASGSMRGRKIDVCKKAGIALAYKALQEKDKVGLIVFGSDIKEEIAPTHDFSLLLNEIARIRASRETNLAAMLKKAIELFPETHITKHLILLSDALPTIGEDPEKETLEMVSLARSHGITISVIGIQLDEKGRKLAEKIAQLGEGRLFIVRKLEEVDKVVLEDYYSVG